MALRPAPPAELIANKPEDMSAFQWVMREDNVERAPTQHGWRGRDGFKCPAPGCDVEKRDKFEMGRHFHQKHPEYLDEMELHQYRYTSCDSVECFYCKRKVSQRRFKNHKCVDGKLYHLVHEMRQLKI